MYPAVLLGLVWECEDLNPSAQTAQPSMVFALANGVDTGLELVEDLHGAPVIGG